MKMIKSLGVLALVCLYTFCTAQENNKVTSNLEFTLNQGLLFYTANDVTANTTILETELTICDFIPRWCPKIGIEWWRIPPRIDIWFVPPIIVRPWPLPLPPTDPWDQFDICQLEFGRSNLVMLDFGLERQISNGFSLGIEAGMGFESISRNTSEVNGFNFTVTNMTNPVMNYNLELSYAISDRLSANVNVGMLNSYFGDLTVLADDGSSVVYEGFVAQSPRASVGIGIKL